MSEHHVPSHIPTPRPLCAVYAPLLPLLATEALNLDEERAVREHLADCAWCQNQRAAYDVVEQALREHVGESAAYRPNQPFPLSGASSLAQPSQPDEKLLTLEAIVSASQRNRPSTNSGTNRGWRDIAPEPAAPRDPRRRRPLVATVGAVAATLLIVILAASLFALLSRRAPSPGSSPGTADCASILHDLHDDAVLTDRAVPDPALPAGALLGKSSSSFGGPSQFSVAQGYVCYSGTTGDVTSTTKGAKSVANALVSAGWSASPSFPYHGALLQPCSGQCFESKNTRYLATDQVIDHGGNLITYQLQSAAPSATPTCNSNFANSPLQGAQTSVESVPLPPITYVVPDDAANLHGYDLCSSGTAASVSAFLTNSLPSSGWTKGSDPRCFYADECWTKSSNIISWNAGDPTDWHIAYHPTAG